jgi:uncharacterized protein YodC (DUF2158 family)
MTYFNVGDVVELNSGSVLMTVTSTYEDQNSQIVRCVFANQYHSFERPFDSRVLKLVEKSI